MNKWKRMSDSSYELSLGNNLYIRILPVKVWIKGVRNHQLVGRYKERDFWSPEVVAGNVQPEPVRRWGGGGDGHGNYPTLKAAKAAGIQDARYVAQAITNQLEMLK